MAAVITSGLITVGNGDEANSVEYAYTTSFYQRVAMIAVRTAYAVCREDPTTTGHANRASKALQFLSACSDPMVQIRMAMVVLEDYSITLTSTSQQIADKLAAIWDTISGN